MTTAVRQMWERRTYVGTRVTVALFIVASITAARLGRPVWLVAIAATLLVLAVGCVMANRVLWFQGRRLHRPASGSRR